MSKQKQEIKIEGINIKIRGKVMTLTLDEARELKAKLEDFSLNQTRASFNNIDKKRLEIIKRENDIAEQRKEYKILRDNYFNICISDEDQATLKHLKPVMKIHTQG